MDNEICINNYVLLRLDRNRHGGGVLLHVLNCLSHSVVFSGSVDLELLVVSVNFPCQSNVALAVFYHHPSSSVSIFDTLLSVLYPRIDVSCFLI